MATSAKLHAPTEPAGQDTDLLEFLILDDLETDRLRLIRLCKRAGLRFRVSEAATVSAFRKLLETNTPDVVFLDYALGYETGLDALTALKDHPRHGEAIAIMVSTLDDLDLAIEAMRRGCADYINKEELTVEAIRKSMALAFERRLLMSALADAEASEKRMRLLMSRIAQTCGREIRTVIAASLEQVSVDSGKGSAEKTCRLEESLRKLDRLCAALNDYMVEIGDGSPTKADAKNVLGPRLVDRPPR